MSFLTHNKLKIIIGTATGINIRKEPIEKGPLVDHSPTPDGYLPPVAVEVFYEALCPDSKSFIIRQLSPTFEKAARLISITFVPYGKATTSTQENGDITFSCQHGPTECFANKIHACGVDAVKNQSLQLEYVACMIADNYDPVAAGRSCAHKLGIEWDTIQKCATGSQGSILLKKNGELTSALSPKVVFIPTVTLDARQDDQRSILKDLFKQVCSHFKTVPEECENAR